MIDIDAMIRKEIENGYGDANAQAKVCQDLILKAIATSSLNRNVTIKGGVVMRRRQFTYDKIMREYRSRPFWYGCGPLFPDSVPVFR